MGRESEVVTYLRTDTTLGTLAPGGVYADADLDVIGISDPTAMPDVWTGGVFNATIVVRERAPVPTGDLQSTQSQHTSTSQALEIWAYGKTQDAIEAALNRVYTLMMGKRLARAFSATWAGGGPLMQAPELPAGILTRHEDYRVVTIRRAVTV